MSKVQLQAVIRTCWKFSCNTESRLGYFDSDIFVLHLLQSNLYNDISLSLVPVVLNSGCGHLSILDRGRWFADFITKIFRFVGGFITKIAGFVTITVFSLLTWWLL